MPETMKLFTSTKIKITKNENGEKVSYLEITEVVLVHCNIVNNDYQQNLFVIKRFVSYQIFHQKNLYFAKMFHSEYTEVQFTNEISKLYIEDKTNIINFTH